MLHVETGKEVTEAFIKDRCINNDSAIPFCEPEDEAKTMDALYKTVKRTATQGKVCNPPILITDTMSIHDIFIVQYELAILVHDV